MSGEVSINKKNTWEYYDKHHVFSICMKRYDGRTKPIPKPRPLPVKGKKGKKLVRVTLKFIIIHDDQFYLHVSLTLP